MRGLRVLVTGGAGFIGSHLVDRLMNEGCEVVVLDNFFSGKIGNIKHHLDSGKFRLIKRDVRNSEVAKEAVGCGCCFSSSRHRERATICREPITR